MVLYKAKRMTDGEEVVGSLIIFPDSPLAYIDTVQAMGRLVVDELNNGEVTNLKLTRVLEATVEKV